MSARILICLALTGSIGCTRVAVKNIYCDGTSRWSCDDPAFPSCDLATRQCVAAQRDMAMSGMDGPPAHDLAVDDLAMAACHGPADCPAATPICDGSGQCRACSGAGDDSSCAMRSAATPRCLTSGASAGTCAACNTPGAQSSDCSSAAPVCNSDGTCRACGTHDECTSRICNLDGTCVAAGSVAYADNKNGTCSGVHAATAADPACDITSALAVQPIVRVIGSSTAYARLTLSSGTSRVVGPGVLASPTAIVSGDLTNPAIGVSGTTTVVTLDGLEITSGGASQDGIACSQLSVGPSLTVIRSLVHAVGGAGLNASKCSVTLDRVTIGPSNAGGGIVLAASTYSIINSFIEANGAGAAGVTFNTGTTPIATGFGFQHNTVAKNAGGGVACNVATTITNSIVWGNTTTDTTGSCTLTNTLSTPAPDFVNATGPAYDFHLAGRTATNLASYIDQIASSSVDHDFDGRARPQDIKWDIGAHEVP